MARYPCYHPNSGSAVIIVPAFTFARGCHLYRLHFSEKFSQLGGSNSVTCFIESIGQLSMCEVLLLDWMCVVDLHDRETYTSSRRSLFLEIATSLRRSVFHTLETETGLSRSTYKTEMFQTCLESVLKPKHSNRDCIPASDRELTVACVLCSVSLRYFITCPGCSGTWRRRSVCMLRSLSTAAKTSIWSWRSRRGSSPTVWSTLWRLVTGEIRRKLTRLELVSPRWDFSC